MIKRRHISGSMTDRVRMIFIKEYTRLSCEEATDILILYYSHKGIIKDRDITRYRVSSIISKLITQKYLIVDDIVTQEGHKVYRQNPVNYAPDR